MNFKTIIRSIHGILFISLLTGCGAEATTPTISAETEAAIESDYVYYIKNGALVRADLNFEVKDKGEPETIIGAVNKTTDLSDYDCMDMAKDKSIALFEFRDPNARYKNDKYRFAVRTMDRAVEPMGGERETQAIMADNRIWFLDYIPGEYELGLYTYTSKEGKHLVEPHVYYLYPSFLDNSIWFIKKHPYKNGKRKDVYYYEVGQEKAKHVATDVQIDYIGQNGTYFYGTDYFFSNSTSQKKWFEDYHMVGVKTTLKKITTTGSQQIILREFHQAKDYFADFNGTGVYYLVYKKEDEKDGFLYYYDGKRRRLLGENIVEIMSVGYEWFDLDGKAAVVFRTNKDGKENIYAAYNGQVVELQMREEGEETALWGFDKAERSIYMTTFKPNMNRLYRFRMEDGMISHAFELIAEGEEISFEKEIDGDAIYTITTQNGVSLYREKNKLLDEYEEESVVQDGEMIYAIEFKGDAEEGTLVKIEKDGSKEEIKQGVVLYELREKNLLILSDCSTTPVMKGTLSCYNGKEFHIIDDQVQVFFTEDRRKTVVDFPAEWEG